jgi:hypothetical protein
MHEIEHKSQSNAQLASSYSKRKSSGTNKQRLGSFWKKIPIRDCPVVSQIVDTGKKLIHSFAQEEDKIEGHEQLKSYITNYYKSLFRDHEESNFSMDETRAELMTFLKFSMREILFLLLLILRRKLNVWFLQMKHSKTPCSDDFPAKFYRNIWKIIKRISVLSMPPNLSFITVIIYVATRIVPKD